MRAASDPHLLSRAARAAVKRGERLRKKTAITLAELEAMLATCDDSLEGLRDRAQLCFGFASGGRRRSEIAAADLRDLRRIGLQAYIYRIEHSKTQQGGGGVRSPVLGILGQTQSPGSPVTKGTSRSLAAAAAEAAANLTAKRIPSRHRGLEGWYPYYAGYTEQFAKGIIAAASSGAKLRILDPWNGSGTTTRAALTLGHQATGFDINPVATLVASAKLANPEDVSHVRGLVQRLASFSDVSISTDDPLLRWMGTSAVNRYRAIESHILAELATNERRSTLDPRTATLPPLASFLLLALMRAARSIASVRAGSNPTWTRPAEKIARSQGRRIEQAWVAQISEMSQDLAANASPLSCSGGGSIHLGNSTNLPLDAETIDLVVTSPPYCTRIDYAMGAAFELAALGIRDNSDAHRALRADAMGTPLSRRRDPADLPAHWPSAVKQTLREIKTHTSKASATYYYKTYFQYFDDCLESLSEIHRVLRKGGAAVLVVQSSYYKDVYVDLPNLYVKCAEHLGYERASIGSTTVVRKTLAQINSKSQVHRSRKVYEESAVILSR